ncbi:hypothetical protein F4861DRAFT_357392 [Xylaria intraflava]|nr:hypothetical protein F4861DRAFT_357392 [Xylaria intraflava]
MESPEPPATMDVAAHRNDVMSRRPHVTFPAGGQPSAPAMSRRRSISTGRAFSGPVARRTLGIVLLLITVFLWTASSFFTSYILSDQTYNKPFFVVYINTSFFAVAAIPLSIKYMMQHGGIKQVRVQAMQAWRGRAHMKKKLRARSMSEDSTLEESLLASEDGDPEARGAQKASKQSSLAETVVFSVKFAVVWFFGNYFSSACLGYTSVGSVTILTSTSSAWTLIFCALMRVESFSARKLLGVVASLLGVVLISLVDFSGKAGDGGLPHRTHAEIAIGDAMASLGAIFYGIYVVMMKIRWGDEERVDMPLFFALVGVVNALLLWPLFPLLHYTGIETCEWPPSNTIWVVLVVNSLSCFVSDICWSYAMLLTTPLVSTVGLSLTIPLSLVGEMVHYGQYPSPAYWLGAATVVMSFLFINQTSQENEARPKSSSTESE